MSTATKPKRRSPNNGHEYSKETVTIRTKKPGYTERRCNLCARDRAKEQRERANGLPDGDPRHGTTNGYKDHGCRCASCLVAGSEWNRVKRAQRLARERAIKAEATK